MGRPALPPDQKRNRTISLRLTDAELEQLEERARESGYALVDYCRGALLGTPPNELPDELVEVSLEQRVARIEAEIARLK